MIEKIKCVFTERNAIMHGRRVAQVKEADADAAVDAAEFLERCLG